MTTGPDDKNAFLSSLSVLAPGQEIRFSCHPGVPCFNECCADLDFELSPYDVMRLRAALGMSSRDLIGTHARVVMEDGTGFPRVFLRMREDERKSCPFVREEGCSIYADRPGACRTYPLGRGASLAEDGSVQTRYVVVREDHCKGHGADTVWTIDSWLEDQGLAEYNAMNDRFLAVHAGCKKSGRRAQKAVFAAAFLALYRLDDFGAMLSEDVWRDRLPDDEAKRTSILEEEPARLSYSFEWLEHVLASMARKGSEEP